MGNGLGLVKFLDQSVNCEAIPQPLKTSLCFPIGRSRTSSLSRTAANPASIRYQRHTVGTSRHRVDTSLGLLFAIRNQHCLSVQPLGLVGDLGGYDSGNVGRQTFSYMFGPRLNWRVSRVVPYAQFLFGGAYEWGVVNATGISTTQNGFAMAAGGGVDVNITQHIAVKPIQVEYFMTQLPQLASNLNAVQNNLRYSAGVVFRFGAR
jgi:hypothetical protein